MNLWNSYDYLRQKALIKHSNELMNYHEKVNNFGEFYY